MHCLRTPCHCSPCRDRSRTGALELTALSLKASDACELMDCAGQGGGGGVRAVHRAPGAHAACKTAGPSCFCSSFALALQTCPAHSPVSCALVWHCGQSASESAAGGSKAHAQLVVMPGRQQLHQQHGIRLNFTCTSVLCLAHPSYAFADQGAAFEMRQVEVDERFKVGGRLNARAASTHAGQAASMHAALQPAVEQRACACAVCSVQCACCMCWARLHAALTCIAFPPVGSLQHSPIPASRFECRMRRPPTTPPPPSGAWSTAS